MNVKKVLLAFDGSAQSLNAAELCWSLAAKRPLKITAQHVINTRGLWDFLGFDLPGLTGSGPYIAARETMERELRAIGETLVSVYQTKARSHGLADQCVLDEGCTVTEVLNRSKENDIVVIGHHPYTPQTKEPANGQGLQPRYYNHHSLAEELALVIDKPLLIVQSQCPTWQKVELLLHGDLGIDTSFRAAAGLAAFLDLPLQVNTYFVGDESYQELPDLTELIKESSRLYPDLELKTSRAKLWPSDGDQHLAEVACRLDTLVILPTFSSGQERRSVFGTTTDLFVRYSGLPALLFWPADPDSAHSAEQVIPLTAAVTTN